MNNGSLLNARVGVALHPQSAAVAGGMTYRPQGGVAQSAEQESHTLTVDGSSPSPATRCPMPTKAGAACKGNPAELTGFCIGHSNMIGAALKELLGG